MFSSILVEGEEKNGVGWIVGGFLMAKNFVNFEKSFITNRSSLRLFFCYYNCCCFKEAAPTFSETFPTNFLPKKWPLLKTLLSTMSTCPSPNVPSVAPTLAKFRRRFCGNYIFNYLRVRLDQSAVFREILKLETLLNKVKRGREMVGEITRRERNSLKFSSQRRPCCQAATSTISPSKQVNGRRNDGWKKKRLFHDVLHCWKTLVQFYAAILFSSSFLENKY